jgi:hypothetical protein
MTHLVTKATTPRRQRPAPAKLTIGVLWFLGITALGGGVEMLVFPNGNQYLPADLLDRVPLIDSFILPGLMLALVFGLGSIVVAWGVQRLSVVHPLLGIEMRTGRHWSWAGLVFLGLAFTTWMVVEIVSLGAPWESEMSSGAAAAWVLYGIYGTVAIALLVLPHVRSVREYLDLHAKNQDASL